MERITLLYDETCGFCTSIVHWVSRQKRGNQITVMPCQFALLTSKHNVTERECMTSIQPIFPDGRTITKGEAVGDVLAVLWNSKWPARVVRWPGIRQAINLGYTFIAVNRHRLPGIKQWCAAGGGDNPQCGVGPSSSIKSSEKQQPSETLLL